jgi:hypothetical protein
LRLWQNYYDAYWSDKIIPYISNIRREIPLSQDPLKVAILQAIKSQQQDRKVALRGLASGGAGAAVRGICFEKQKETNGGKLGN